MGEYCLPPEQGGYLFFPIVKGIISYRDLQDMSVWHFICAYNIACAKEDAEDNQRRALKNGKPK